MSLVQCPACGAANRPPAGYCMRCGKPLPARDCAAARHASAFAERERKGPFLGAFPDALDFSLASLPKLDALMSELWGDAGEAPGRPDWQPSAARMPVVIDFGTYLGEVLCRALPARWEMNPQHPEVVIAARVIDAQGRRINPFAQVGARLRDGAGVGLASLYTALTGRALPAWRIPRASVQATPPQVDAHPVPAVAPPRLANIAELMQKAGEHAARGHHGNAVHCLRQALAVEPAHRDARRRLIIALAHAGAIDEALKEVDQQRQLAPGDIEWTDLRAMLQLQSGRVDEALGTLDMALLRQPDEPRLLRRRAFALLKAGRWPRAQAELAQLQARGDDADLALAMAQALIQQGQAAAARIQLERVVSGALADTRPEALAAAREKLAELTSLARAPDPPAARPPADPENPAEAAARAYAAAVDHARNRRFEQALPLFVQAARLRPDYPAYLKDVGHCLHDLGRNAEAREWFEGCLAVDPGYSAARRALGVVAEATGDRGTAISRYREVLSRLDSDPRDVDVAMRRLKALGALPG